MVYSVFKGAKLVYSSFSKNTAIEYAKSLIKPKMRLAVYVKNDKGQYIWDSLSIKDITFTKATIKKVKNTYKIEI